MLRKWIIKWLTGYQGDARKDFLEAMDGWEDALNRTKDVCKLYEEMRDINQQLLDLCEKKQQQLEQSYKIIAEMTKEEQ